MDNFKFTAILAAAPFTDEERRNFTVIFNTLTDKRKMEIIEGWSKYLDRILVIKQKAQAERKRIIQETFENIHHLMDEVYLREQEEKKKKEQQAKEQEEIDRNVAFYHQQKRIEQIRAMERAQETDRGPIDPLLFL